ncbi:MAG: flagellin [Gammaproteobacteria bacterium]|nr:flagellin [Gammaproteobacteria bacterium]
MPQVINTNIMSLNAQRNLNQSQDALRTSLQRLSSGLRINSAKDDAAGLAISERFTTQVRGLTVAERNSNDGISLSQVAEGSLAEATNILQRVRELAVQSMNATNSSSDRQALNSEVSQLVAELERIATAAEFNGQKILDGTFGTAVFQVGANVNQVIIATTNNFRTANYGDYRVWGYGTTAASTSVVASARFTTGTLIITSPQGVATIASATGDSAKKVANNVNLYTDVTGVKAFAETNAQVTFATSGAYSLMLQSNNVIPLNVSFALTAPNSVDALTSAVTAINDFTSRTGVVAEVKPDGTAIILHHYDGENITLTDTTYTNAGNVVVQGVTPAGVTVGAAVTLANNAAAAAVVDKAYVEGQVIFDSQRTFTLQWGVPTQTGVVISASTEASILQQVSSLDISNVYNSKLSLAIADAAIGQISSQRARFGALQSRFESTIRNLQTSVENLSAARSRIRDADFAIETAELTRTQILQQAGTAMLAQANQIPQNVLTLLR